MFRLPRLPAPPPFASRYLTPDPESQIVDIHHAVADASLSLNLTMEAPPGTQRSSQRRQPTGDFVQPTNSSNPSMNTTAASSTAPRTSSGSARSHSSRNLSVSSPRSTNIRFKRSDCFANVHFQDVDFHLATGQADRADREKRHTPPCCHQTIA